MILNKVTNYERVTIGIEALAQLITEISKDCQCEGNGNCQSCQKPWCSYERTLLWLESSCEGSM